MERKPSRFQKAINQKIAVNASTLTRGLDQLAQIIATNDDWAEKLLPLYERLESELVVINKSNSKLDLIRARASAAAQSKDHMASPS